ncbi:hypothetical protein V6N13_014629 [Hibiscus sabdariffa]
MTDFIVDIPLFSLPVPLLLLLLLSGFDFIALFNNSFLSLFDFFLEDCHWVTAMHRVGSAGNNANSNRPRNEKRLTYVLNDTADTKHCAGINCLAVPLC